MRTIVFETPGELDPRAFSLMGVSAKPNSRSPIGKFGTGLKYSIAVLMRLGVKFDVIVGGKSLNFYSRMENFRGKQFAQLFMGGQALPFTGEYGHQWKLWQVFRELESNTRDEGGRTYEASMPPNPDKSVSRIIVESDEFAHIYDNMAQIFLPNARTSPYLPRKRAIAMREQDLDETTVTYDPIQVVRESSQHLYWRGVRVYTFNKPAVNTYNLLLDMALTEDRTLADLWYARHALASYIISHEDEDFINSVLSADDDWFEYSIDYRGVGTPSKEFLRIAKKKANDSALAVLAQVDQESSIAKLPWYEKMVVHLNAGHFSLAGKVMQDHKDHMIHILSNLDPATLPKVEPKAEEEEEIKF